MLRGVRGKEVPDRAMDRLVRPIAPPNLDTRGPTPGVPLSCKDSGQPCDAPDVKKLWEQASQDPSFDRERREIARELAKLGVRVNRR